MGSTYSLLPGNQWKIVSRYLEERAYQIDILTRALKSLQGGSNVMVSLPTGLGKTLISQLAAITWLKLNSKLVQKVLVIVPNKLCLGLYPAEAAWIQKLIAIHYLDDSLPFSLFPKQIPLEQVDMLVCTPRRMTYALMGNELPIVKLKYFNLVVFDDYDELASQASDAIKNTRNDLEMVMASLAASRPRFLLMSACDPKMNMGLSEWENIMKPVVVKVDPASYQAHIPLVHIQPKGILDYEVIRNDRKLSQCIAVNLQFIKEQVYAHSETHHPVKMKQVLDQMRGIASGKQKAFYLRFRKSEPLKLPIDKPLKLAFRNISLAVQTRLQLFEDMWAEPELGAPSKDSIKALNRWGSLSNLRVNLNGKVNFIEQIVRERNQERGLILCRRLELCELLAGVILNMGLPVYIVHEKLAPAELKKRLDGYKRYKTAILLSPHLLGIRGLLVQDADYAVFYSPKDQEKVMRQEIARIQSMRQHPKEVFILYYQDTGEESKLNRLFWGMKGKTNYLLA